MEKIGLTVQNKTEEKQKMDIKDIEKASGCEVIQTIEQKRIDERLKESQKNKKKEYIVQMNTENAELLGISLFLLIYIFMNIKFRL
jgi:enoyl-[acyl-carrier-protein] reductase (NADH)